MMEFDHFPVDEVGISDAVLLGEGVLKIEKNILGSITREQLSVCEAMIKNWFVFGKKANVDIDFLKVLKERLETALSERRLEIDTRK